MINVELSNSKRTGNGNSFAQSKEPMFASTIEYVVELGMSDLIDISHNEPLEVTVPLLWNSIVLSLCTGWKTPLPSPGSLKTLR